jgi:hypothetical protein
VSLFVPAPAVRSRADQAAVSGSLFDRPAELHNRRELNPVDQLSRELGDACTCAVDALEIAAILEAQGITDSVSRDLYNCDDVFDLAERLWVRTPAVIDATPTSVYTDRPGSVRDLLHGVLFAVNGLFFSAGLQVGSSKQTTAVLVAALIVSWAVGQTASLLWFRVEARKGDGAGRAVMRRAMQIVLAAGLVFGILVDRLDTIPAVTLLGVGQVYLVMAMSVLLLYRKELWFFITLVPGCLIAIIALAAVGYLPGQLMLATVVGTIMVVVVEALIIVRPGVSGSAERLNLEWPDLGHAIQMSLYGVLGAVLLSHSAVAKLLAAEPLAVSGFDMSVVPLVLTIGVAEWQLRTYRQLTRQVLGLTDDLVRFGAVAWRFLLRSCFRYWASLVAASVVLWVAVRIHEGSVSADSTLLTIAYAVFGAALFLNLVLIAHARVDIAVRAFIVAGTVYGIEMVVQWSVQASPTVFTAAYLVLCCGLLASLLFTTRHIVRQALVHL